MTPDQSGPTHEPYLLQRCAEGCHSGRRLWLEIQAQGYTYCLTAKGFTPPQAAGFQPKR
jgi:hypothetical protein